MKNLHLNAKLLLEGQNRGSLEGFEYLIFFSLMKRIKIMELSAKRIKIPKIPRNSRHSDEFKQQEIF